MAAHAVARFAAQFPGPTSSWMSTNETIVLCAASDELSLDLVRAAMAESGALFATFYEPDRSGELTAVATLAENGVRYLCHLPLIPARPLGPGRAVRGKGGETDEPQRTIGRH